jgi:hypothetical protein
MAYGKSVMAKKKSGGKMLTAKQKTLPSSLKKKIMKPKGKKK